MAPHLGCRCPEVLPERLHLPMAQLHGHRSQGGLRSDRCRQGVARESQREGMWIENPQKNGALTGKIREKYRRIHLKNGESWWIMEVSVAGKIIELIGGVSGKPCLMTRRLIMMLLGASFQFLVLGHDPSYIWTKPTWGESLGSSSQILVQRRHTMLHMMVIINTMG